MHPQLEILLEMQDLRSQARALREEAAEREVESDVFDMKIEEALEHLREKVRELEDRLDPEVRSTYDRIAGQVDRVVVPVLNGICYGCFMAVPRAWASEAKENESVRVCENCGRFLYYVD